MVNAIHEKGPWLLFDDVEDPLQMNNLVGVPEHAALQQEMHALLVDWIDRTGDEFPPPGS